MDEAEGRMVETAAVLPPPPGPHPGECCQCQGPTGWNLSQQGGPGPPGPRPRGRAWNKSVLGTEAPSRGKRQ